MSLSREDEERLRAEERIKLEVREEFNRETQSRRDKERERDFVASMFDGGPGGICPNCEKNVRSRWTYCPGCGVQIQRTCLWCSVRLPEGEDMSFCPHCGKRT